MRLHGMTKYLFERDPRTDHCDPSEYYSTAAKRIANATPAAPNYLGVVGRICGLPQLIIQQKTSKGWGVDQPG